MIPTRRLPSLIPILRPLPLSTLPRRPYSTVNPHADRVPTNDPKPHNPVQNVSETNTLPVTTGGMIDGELQEGLEEAEERRVMQAPNREGVWSRSQQPREVAMSGPRFEQTIMELQVSNYQGLLPGLGHLKEELAQRKGLCESGATIIDQSADYCAKQPRPYSAIELIHKQPVRWTDKRVVSCDGGGGPLGHPKIFINVDKPQINMCTYCGLPFVSDIYGRYVLVHADQLTRRTTIIGNTLRVCPTQFTH
jgi:NADH dehydrogenase (ubiquinone) Fe-S protein 6